MTHRQENRSVDSEYTEYTVEDEVEGDEEEKSRRLQPIPHPLQVPQHHSNEEVEEEEYDFEPSSVVLSENNAYHGSSAAVSASGGPLSNSQKKTMGRHHQTGATNDMEKILRIQNKRIKMLLEANKAKEERIQNLQTRLHHQKVRHKEGVYWLQLQLDTARREKDAVEERMAELQADLRQLAQIEDTMQNEENGIKAEMNQKLQKYGRTMGVMENQISMIKTSCGEVIKTLEEEIADLIEDRSRMEVDLLNQLSTLDNEKKQAELEYELRLNEKDEMIERLQSNGIVEGETCPEMELLREEIERLQALNEQTEELARKERTEADQAIHWLKEDKERMEKQLEMSAGDLALLQSEMNTKDAIAILDRVTQERETINEFLARVTAVWEMADASMSNLEDTVEQLRPTDNAQVSGDRETMLSMLESASLLHGQIKVSLQLIELKLRNQLQCVTNDKLTMGKAAPSDLDVTKTMEEIQKDTLTALSQVESSLLTQMIQLKQTALKEAAETKCELRERVKKLEEMREGYNRLKGEVTQLKESNQGSDCFVQASSSEGEDADSKKGGHVVAISGPVMSQLHQEVLRIVERVQEKNKIIASLKEELEDHRIREENLRKELKRALRANHASQNVTRTAPHTPTKMHSPAGGTKPKTKKISSVDKKHLSSPLSLQSPVKTSVITPVNVKDELFGVTSTGNALYTPNSSIRPLQPSPREISKPRHLPTSPWVPGSLEVMHAE
jgi:hypothetical protein